MAHNDTKPDAPSLMPRVPRGEEVLNKPGYRGDTRTAGDATGINVDAPQAHRSTHAKLATRLIRVVKDRNERSSRHCG